MWEWLLSVPWDAVAGLATTATFTAGVTFAVLLGHTDSTMLSKSSELPALIGEIRDQRRRAERKWRR